MTRLSPFACIAAALLLLLLPLNWLLAAVAAAFLHEIGHFIAISATGGKVRGLRIGLKGARMDTLLTSSKQELLCAAAGPLASFALLMLDHIFPRLAICALIQGAFNLLPVYPFDGGRILRCLLFSLTPAKADSLTRWASWAVYGISFLAALSGWIRWGLGVLPLLCWLGAVGSGVFGKIPCKKGGNRVQ